MPRSTSPARTLLLLLALLSLTACTAAFSCDNGNSVPDLWVCDGDNDCGDCSDERQGSCSTPCVAAGTSFVCDNGNRVPTAWVCDGTDDCGDCSDEQCAGRLCVPTGRAGSGSGGSGTNDWLVPVTVGGSVVIMLAFLLFFWQPYWRDNSKDGKMVWLVSARSTGENADQGEPEAGDDVGPGVLEAAVAEKVEEEPGAAKLENDPKQGSADLAEGGPAGGRPATGALDDDEAAAEEQARRLAAGQAGEEVAAKHTDTVASAGHEVARAAGSASSRVLGPLGQQALAQLSGLVGANMLCLVPAVDFVLALFALLVSVYYWALKKCRFFTGVKLRTRLSAYQVHQSLTTSSVPLPLFAALRTYFQIKAFQQKCGFVYRTRLLGKVPALDFAESCVLIAYDFTHEMTPELIRAIRYPIEVGMVSEDSKGRPTPEFHNYCVSVLRPMLAAQYKGPRFCLCLCRCGSLSNDMLPMLEYGMRRPRAPVGVAPAARA